ncbi:MFS transporter [Sphingomonas sp. HF-S4]|uniref:MFS transporter n=1 Tax=Sphingomonas agrestis TaxID=3080540 RepID=A0ABU3Y1W7_9SPHN|nr:MFS transporter [Sphingomonas sp. HF-S4]MDV3455375.1 MFS transporter [Sphingomonas sp. HF-S4]
MTKIIVPDAAHESPWPHRRTAAWALALLFFAYVLAFLDRIVLSILVRPISAELQLSDMQFALVGGVAFALFYVTMGLPIGWLADRFSRRRIVAVGVALWSLCTIASGLASDFAGLFAARLGVGIGEAALAPAAYSLIADLYPPERRGRAVALYTLGATIGSSIAYFAGGLLIEFASAHGAILGLPPWRFVFFAAGAPGILLAALMLTMREPARRQSARVAKPASFVAFLKARREVSIAYILGYSCINLPFAGFLLWGPALFDRVHGLRPAQLALPLALLFLVPTALGQWLGATVTDRMLAKGRADAAFRTAAVCAALLVPVAVAMPLLGDSAAALAALGLLLFLTCASVGHHAVVAATVAPNRLRGLYVALFFFVQNVMGQAIIAVITAGLTDHVFERPDSIGLSMAIVGGAGAAAGTLLLILGREALRRAAAEPHP